MGARIDARFATAKETASVLGVPSSRMKKLVGLTGSTLRKAASGRWHAFKTQEANGSRNKTNGVPVNVYFKKSDSKNGTTPKKRSSTKKSVSRKRRARGKLAKATR
jgi:hypothetical protein